MALNTLAVLFIFEVDNLVFSFWFSDDQQAYFAETAKFTLPPEHRKAEQVNKPIYLLAACLSTLLPIYLLVPTKLLRKYEGVEAGMVQFDILVMVMYTMNGAWASAELLGIAFFHKGSVRARLCQALVTVVSVFFFQIVNQMAVVAAMLS